MDDSKELKGDAMPINDELPFEPKCPQCGSDIVVEKGSSGLYANCETCGSDFASSPFSDQIEEARWIDTLFHKSDEEPEVPPPSEPDTDSKTLFEIAHSSWVLHQAIEKVREAYDLIQKDNVARRYINFNSALFWNKCVWDILQKEYDKAKPGNKDVYFLRAFDFFGVQPGVNIGDGSCTCAPA